MAYWLGPGIKERGALRRPTQVSRSMLSMDRPVRVLHKYLAVLNGVAI